MIWTRWRKCTLIPKPAPANLGTMRVYSLYLWILGNIQWEGRICTLIHASDPPLIMFSHTKVQKVEPFLCISAIRLLNPLKIVCLNPFQLFVLWFRWSWWLNSVLPTVYIKWSPFNIIILTYNITKLVPTTRKKYSETQWDYRGGIPIKVSVRADGKLRCRF